MVSTRCQSPLSCLQSLEWLDAGSVAGPLPVGLGTLSSLTDLSLGGREDVWEKWGQDPITTIPASLGQLRGLQRLHLWCSDVQDTELPVIGGLTALKILHVHLPQLTSLQPLVHLRSLEDLDLDCPRLRALPDLEFRLPKLTEVKLKVGALQKPATPVWPALHTAPLDNHLTTEATSSTSLAPLLSCKISPWGPAVSGPSRMTSAT